jgi:hypothetical protein
VLASLPPTPFWSPDTGLPRLIIINAQMPYKGPTFSGLFSRSSKAKADLKDKGYSILLYSLVKEETCRAARNLESGPEGAAVRLFQKIYESGVSTEKMAIKVIGLLDNFDELGAPEFTRHYNGKPVTCIKSTSLHKENGILEITINVRVWCVLCRQTLPKLHDAFTHARANIGILIEGREEEDLPERLVSSFHLREYDWDSIMCVDDC